MSQPLSKRKAPLKLLEGSGLLVSDELNGPALDVVQAMKSLGLEGVIAKRRNSLYQPGERSTDWHCSSDISKARH